ncbi:hypothetical protein EWM64_g4621 [Hericium alpestre]|uniref:DUF6534 domain-containing protein n=1 Tax=Hericium alpestre TaxID=135208 RepID=A0A4Z0A0S9_9AGAM|nr:hypothetical protein EWM64_g4621 [Hericium alpestre]
MDTAPPDESHNAIIWLAGPRLIGLFFNWGLLGILTVQVYIYFVNFPKDKRGFKVLSPLYSDIVSPPVSLTCIPASVYTVYLVDWAQTCSATYDGFQWFVYGWGDINVLNSSETGYLNVPILSSIVAITVQIFFGWRIWTFSKSFVPLVCIVVLAVVQLGGAIAVAYFVATVPLENAREPGLPDAVGIRLGTSVVADAIISISMTYFVSMLGTSFADLELIITQLLKKRETAIKLNNVLTRLVRLTIETGTVTALFAIMDLVFFLAAHNGLHEVSGVALAKLYSNSLLATFNNRLLMASDSFNAHGRHRMHCELENNNSAGSIFEMSMHHDKSVDSGETVGAGMMPRAKRKSGVRVVRTVNTEEDEVQIPSHAHIPV